jgi:hypothetical protein
MNFEVGVIAVGFARQQRFDLLACDFGSELLERRLGLGDDIRIALLLAHLDELEIVGELGFEPLQSIYRIVEMLPLAHQLLRFLGVIPD